MITIEHITKRYGDTLALDDISVQVAEGELFGFIGPDGAGKSSLFRLLTTLLLPDEGQLSFNQHDIVKEYRYVRRNVGYMPGNFSLYQDLSVEENLRFFARVFNTTVKENYHLIEDIYVQLEPFKKRKAGALSGGMKQKLALCCALIHKPLVLVLDEPTTGVDVVSRREFWAMLKKLKKEGLTILVSTPYMDEAAMCDRVALMQNGKILSMGTPQDIIDSYELPIYKASSHNLYQLLLAVRLYPGVSDAFPFGESLHVSAENPLDLPEMEEVLKSKGFEDIHLEETKPGIEDCFMHMMKGEEEHD